MSHKQTKLRRRTIRRRAPIHGAGEFAAPMVDMKMASPEELIEGHKRWVRGELNKYRMEQLEWQQKQRHALDAALAALQVQLRPLEVLVAVLVHRHGGKTCRLEQRLRSRGVTT